MDKKRLDWLTNILIRLHVFHRADREYFSIMRTYWFEHGEVIDIPMERLTEIQNVWSERYRLPFGEACINHSFTNYCANNGAGRNTTDQRLNFEERTKDEYVASVYAVSEWLRGVLFRMGEPVISPVSSEVGRYWLSEYDYQYGMDELVEHPVLRAIAEKYEKELVEDARELLNPPSYDGVDLNATAEVMEHSSMCFTDGVLYYKQFFMQNLHGKTVSVIATFYEPNGKPVRVEEIREWCETHKGVRMEEYIKPMDGKEALAAMKAGYDVVSDGDVFFTDIINTPWDEQISVVCSSKSKKSVPQIICEEDDFPTFFTPPREFKIFKDYAKEDDE